MNITRTNTDDLNAVIKLQLVKEDYASQVDSVLKEYRRKASIDGFRPGKVPMGLIKKMYGAPVLADEVNKVLSQELYKYIEENKLDILGEPLPNKTEQKSINWEKDTEFEFVFDIAMTPEYTLNLSKRDKINFFKITIDEKMIQNAVDMHTHRLGSDKEAEIVEDKEVLNGNLAQLDTEGNVVEGGIANEDVAISLEYMEDEESKTKFVGANVNQIITFNPAKAFPDRTDLVSMLDITPEMAETLESDFQYTITDISKFVPAEMNQEFFDKIFGEGKVTSEEEFKNQIKADIEAQLVDNSNHKFLIDGKEKLVKKAKIELPVAFLKRWIVATNKEMTAEQVESDFENYSDDFRWQLIKDKLVKDNDLKVNEEEVIEFAKKQVLIQFRQFGIMKVPEEYLTNHAKQMLENKDEARKTRARKLDDKVVEYLKNTIKVEEKEISTEEFSKMLE